MLYKQMLINAMEHLAKDERTIFVGQSMLYPGTFMYDSMLNVPREKRYEWPVAEEQQLGVCIGLSERGFVPVCIYPRFNFILLAINQLVNHVDKWEQMTGNKPKIIIRTAVGSSKPLYPGPQHTGDFSVGLSMMCEKVKILYASEGLYRRAIECAPCIIVERAEKYNQEI